MSDIRAICFYLPQFHPIPENDEWWGKGFTEWRNVAKATPQFPGHYQPHIPADLGFYDLRLPEAREAQAALAREYGIFGFCYYHYWFNGRRILERPFNEVLNSGKPDFPFCLCWANENWSRRWDGSERNILLEQKYSADDDLAHIRSLIPALADERYIRVNGRPLLLIYRTTLIPDPARTAEIWREEVSRAGLGDLYLARVESFGEVVDPRTIGFDAAVEFAPFGGLKGELQFHDGFYSHLAKVGLLPKAYIENSVMDYATVARSMLNRPAPPFKHFHCVTPSWDNSARRKKDALILDGATPKKYEAWLREAARRTLEKYDGDEALVFVNAWNEWAEGNHLEPDLRWGRAYLEATRCAIADPFTSVAPGDSAAVVQSPGLISNMKWKTNALVRKAARLYKQLQWPLAR